jgi:poly(ADP-ribose) glycohydrolase ARH3
MTSLLEKMQGAMLGCAIGDALGRPFESSLFSDARLAPLVEARAQRQSLWAYSDDTQMMISVAESLLQKNTIEPEHLVQTLARNYDPARGYGKGMKLVFQALERGLSWEEAARSSWAEGSKGNGAAVRVVPIACRYFRDPETIRHAAQTSSLVSHTHPIAITGCVLQAAALSYLLAIEDSQDFSSSHFIESLSSELRGDLIFEEKLRTIAMLYQKDADKAEAVKALGNGSSADEAVPLALFCLLTWAPSVEAIILNTLQCGGDTDSIAALSSALSGALFGVKRIPEQWVQNLEERPKGREYLLSLAERLYLLALETL